MAWYPYSYPFHCTRTRVPILAPVPGYLFWYPYPYPYSCLVPYNNCVNKGKCLKISWKLVRRSFNRFTAKPIFGRKKKTKRKFFFFLFFFFGRDFFFFLGGGDFIANFYLREKNFKYFFLTIRLNFLIEPWKKKIEKTAKYELFLLKPLTLTLF